MVVGDDPVEPVLLQRWCFRHAEFDKYIEQLGHDEELVIVSGAREIARMVPTPATRHRVAAEIVSEQRG